MKKQIAVLIAVAALLVSALGYVAYSAQSQFGPGAGQGKFSKGRGGPMGGGMGMMGDMGKRMMGGGGMDMMLRNPKTQKKLGLTDDQKAKLKTLSSDSMRKSIKNEADIKILFLDLKDLMSSPKPDTAKVDSKIDEIAAACSAEAKLMIHTMIASRSVLTPEQLEKLEGMRGKMEWKGMKGQGIKERGKEKGMKGGKGMGKDKGTDIGKDKSKEKSESK